MSDEHLLSMGKYQNPEIEATIRYLTTDEGGRQSGVYSGYRGQFYYGGQDYDGFQYFPDVPLGVMIELGDAVRAYVEFGERRWREFHSRNVYVGMPFEIREGPKTVGRGTVNKILVD